MESLKDIINKAYWYKYSLEGVVTKVKESYQGDIDSLIQRYGLTLDTIMYFIAGNNRAYSLNYVMRSYPVDSAIPTCVGSLDITRGMYEALSEDGIFNPDKISMDFELHDKGLLKLPDKKLAFRNKFVRGLSFTGIYEKIYTGCKEADNIEHINFVYGNGYLCVDGIVYDMRDIEDLDFLGVQDIVYTSIYGRSVLFVKCRIDIFQKVMLLIPKLNKLWTTVSLMQGVTETNLKVVKDSDKLRKILLDYV